MKQILGNDLKVAFEILNINAGLKHKDKEYEVWELSDDDYERLCNIPDEEWKDDFGWWRWGECILDGDPLHEYEVNGQKMLGYMDKNALEDLNNGEKPEDMLDESYFTDQAYGSFTEWLCGVMRCSTEKHIACFAVSLAKANGISLADFMDRYQP